MAIKNNSINISIFEVTGKMKHPTNDFEMSHCLIPVTFSNNPNGRVARAWFGYSDNCLGKAGGGGYDKESTALAAALVELTGNKELYDMGSGWQSVAEKSQKLARLEIKKVW